MNTITVTKFNNYVKNIFNAEELLHNIKIVGEVFGVSYSKTATYFSIKDEESSLPCICFDSALEGLQEGSSVVVTGSPNFYTKSGRFNFVVTKLEPYGQGVLFQRFIEMRDKLAKEGLFDEAHKKKIPENIKRIGVVTSKEGAVLQDIKNVTWRRNPNIDIVLYSTKVQGKNAEFEIADGINFFSEYDGVDVVVVARGGGSLDDLWAYNTEVVARAAYACKKPLISAVGHEVDFTIIDFVSDLRAPTPSAAAELLSNERKGLENTFKKCVGRLSRQISSILADKTLQFQGTKNLILTLMEDNVKNAKNSLTKLTANISNKLNTYLVQKDYETKLKIEGLKRHNPLDILALGYAKIEQQGLNISKKAELDTNKPFEINFIDGKITAITGGEK